MFRIEYFKISIDKNAFVRVVPLEAPLVAAISVDDWKAPHLFRGPAAEVSCVLFLDRKLEEKSGNFFRFPVFCTLLCC